MNRRVVLGSPSRAVPEKSVFHSLPVQATLAASRSRSRRPVVSADEKLGSTRPMAGGSGGGPLEVPGHDLRKGPSVEELGIRGGGGTTPPRRRRIAIPKHLNRPGPSRKVGTEKRKRSLSPASSSSSIRSAAPDPRRMRMAADWNHLMPHYGTYLSQSTVQNMDNDPLEDIPFDDVLEGSRPAPAAKKGATRTKLANFSSDEDVTLCRTWLSVSCDPIVNTGQKKQGFWNRITQLYNSRRGDNPERSTKSLMSRWDNIKAQCSLFSGYMAAVLRQNPSGLTDVDKTSLAVIRFGSVEKKPFHFLHCWGVLKDEPKWMDHHIGQQPCTTPPMPNESNTVDLDPEDSILGSTTSKRPLGHDSSKAKGKKAKSMTTSETDSEHLQRIGELSLQRLSMYQHATDVEERKLQEYTRLRKQKMNIEKKKLSIERERLDMEKSKQATEEKLMIMGKDLNSCNPMQRQCYLLKQQKVIVKLSDDGGATI